MKAILRFLALLGITLSVIAFNTVSAQAQSGPTQKASSINGKKAQTDHEPGGIYHRALLIAEIKKIKLNIDLNLKIAETFKANFEISKLTTETIKSDTNLKATYDIESMSYEQLSTYRGKLVILDKALISLLKHANIEPKYQGLFVGEQIVTPLGIEPPLEQQDILNSTSLSPSVLLFGLSDFIVDRAKAEFVIASIEQIRKINDTLLTSFFKNTFKFIENSKSIDVKSFLPALRAAVISDYESALINLSEFLESRLGRDSTGELQRTFAVLYSIGYALNGVQDGGDPLNMLSRFSTNAYLRELSSCSIKDDKAKAVMKTFYAIGTIAKEYTISRQQLPVKMQDHEFRVHFIRILNNELEDKFSEEGVIAIDPTTVFEIVNKIERLYQTLQKVEKSATSDERAKYAVSIVQTLGEILGTFEIKGLGDNNLKEIENILSKAILIEKCIVEKDYVKAGTVSVGLIGDYFEVPYLKNNAIRDEIASLKDTISLVESRLLSLKRQLLAISQSNGRNQRRDSLRDKRVEAQAKYDKLETKLKDLMGKVEQRYNLTKVVSFAGNLASAQTPEDVTAVIEQFAAPVGSYRAKRMGETQFTLNSYLGGTFGFESIDYENTKGGLAAGFMVSVGLEYEVSSSFGLYVSVLELGALANYRLTNTAVNKNDQSSSNETESNGNDNTSSAGEVSPLPEVGLAQVFSPGIFLIYQPTVEFPISIGAGAQFAPKLRQITKDGVVTNSAVNAGRYYVFVAIDLVLFAL